MTFPRPLDASGVTDAGATPGRIYLNGATIMSTSTERLIVIARDAGFDGVEVRAERLLGSPSEVRAAAAVAMPGEAWSLNGIQLQLRDGGILDRAQLDEDLPPRLEICRALGAAYLLVVPPRGAGPDHPARDRGRIVDAMREGVRVLRDRAGAAGVRVAFEFLGFGDCPIDTPALAGAVAAGEDGVDVVIDSCHWHASGSGSLAAFPIERLAMVHLNDAPAKPPRDVEDADRVLPGAGVIRLGALLAELRARGYRGPFSLETFNPAFWDGDPMVVARRGMAAMERVLGAPTPPHEV